MNKLKRTLLKFSSLCILLISLCGCWDVKDINHRTMPVVLGITSENDGYKVYLQIAEPVGDTLVTNVVIGEGKTLNHVIDNISADMESRIDLLHVKVIVVDHSLAEKGLKDLISSFMRSRDVSSKALMATTKGDMNEFFEGMKEDTAPIGTIPLDYFEKNAGWNPQIALTRIWKVYQSIHSHTQDTAIPIIQLGETTMIDQVGSAIIRTGKVVEEINSDETLLYNALWENSTQGMIEVLDEASVMILGNSVDYDSKFTNDQANLTANLNLNVMVLETKGDPSKSEINKQLKALLQNRFDKMIEKLQTSEADVLGTGRYFRNKMSPSELKQWRSKYYPDLNFTLNIHVDIQNEGNLKTLTN
ncbi:Ger(x)C family spore germination protein [Ornithinibacillus salinisoli]|uniref:Ger(X)C family spore germination protein n=1 Tax=Ornithinibacillus salinisoli TaxID=1848459 RepID=A0ABW4VYN9_9BACI